MKFLPISLLLLMSVAGRSSACSPKAVMPSAIARESTAILVGYVTGGRFERYETAVLSGSDPNKAIPWEGCTVRVAFTEALKGKLSPPVEVLAGPCGEACPPVRTRVVVAQREGHNMMLNEWLEREVRSDLSEEL